jgi:hypothetical protein
MELVQDDTFFLGYKEARSSTWDFLGMSEHKYLVCLKILTCKKDSCSELPPSLRRSCARYLDAQIVDRHYCGLFSTWYAF